MRLRRLNHARSFDRTDKRSPKQKYGYAIRTRTFPPVPSVGISAGMLGMRTKENQFNLPCSFDSGAIHFCAR